MCRTCSVLQEVLSSASRLRGNRTFPVALQRCVASQAARRTQTHTHTVCFSVLLSALKRNTTQVCLSCCHLLPLIQVSLQTSNKL